MITDLPASLPTLPRYGESSLADLASSVLASLGVAGEANPLGLAPAERVCLLVVDGLGWELLRDHPAAAPFLSELAVTGRPLTAGFPATTVTSLTSLGTGLVPGMAGCSTGCAGTSGSILSCGSPVRRSTNGPRRRGSAPTGSPRPRCSGRD